jgi:release factor glutamine methyltransferase
MINSKQLLQDFISRIDRQADAKERSLMASLVLEKVFAVSQTDILREKEVTVDQHHLEELDRIVKRINSNEPIQYILNTAYFFGRKFYVDEAVLIPRPETEELVGLVIDLYNEAKIRRPKILDIGTGSGCIPITLSLELPASQVFGLDKSKSALAVAKKNAESLGANVTLLEDDILSGQLSLDEFDIIVSNPPYIPLEEIHQIRPNVKDFEPHMALFVDDHDPLVFYSAIAQLGKKSLNSNGFIAVEINERFGRDTKNVFDKFQYTETQIAKDMSGKNRFVVAKK